MSEQTKHEWPELDIEILNSSKGVFVQQGDRNYLAKGWRVTNELCNFMNEAFSKGFVHLFQKGHPRESNWISGVDYISFGSSYDGGWVFAIDQYSGRPNIKQVTIRKDYVENVVQTGLPYEWESGGGKNIFMDHHDFLRLIQRTEKLA